MPLACGQYIFPGNQAGIGVLAGAGAERQEWYLGPCKLMDARVSPISRGRLTSKFTIDV